MAASDEVTASREVFLEGDVAYKRAISESMLKKHGAQNNFVNKYQTDIKQFHLNGHYSVATGITFYDGVATMFYNSEIVGISFWNGVSGVSGITDFDVEWINTSGGLGGSIFSTNPTIDSTSFDNTFAFRNLTTSNDVTDTGVVLPVLSKTTFLEGESLYFKLNSAMPGAMNCGLCVYYRPRN